MTGTLNCYYKGVRITKMDLTYDMDLSKYTEQQINVLKEKDFCSVVKTSMSQYADAFENCSQDISNKHLIQIVFPVILFIVISDSNSNPIPFC